MEHGLSIKGEVCAGDTSIVIEAGGTGHTGGVAVMRADIQLHLIDLFKGVRVEPFVGVIRSETEAHDTRGGVTTEYGARVISTVQPTEVFPQNRLRCGENPERIRLCAARTFSILGKGFYRQVS